MVIAAYLIGALMAIGGAITCYILWPESAYARELPFAMRIPALTALLSGFVFCFGFCVLAKILDGVILLRRTLKIADSDSSLDSGRYEPLPPAPGEAEYRQRVRAGHWVNDRAAKPPPGAL